MSNLKRHQAAEQWTASNPLPPPVPMSEYRARAKQAIYRDWVSAVPPGYVLTWTPAKGKKDV